jgi:transcriptional regulator
MVITRLSGKWKVSQNQPPQNQASVIQGLKDSGQNDAAALVNAGTEKAADID